MSTYKKIIALCDSQNKQLGRNNSGCKYKNLDDNFLHLIDTEDKAYLLGWLASDGHISQKGQIYIYLQVSDIEIINQLIKIIGCDIPIKFRYINGSKQVGFVINSTKMTNDICKHLNIKPGKKSHLVNFPNLPTDQLKWRFIQGYFEGDGTINNPYLSTKSPVCSIASNSQNMIQGIKDFTQIPCSLNKIDIRWYGNNCLDFLGKIYHSSSFRLERKYDLYNRWLSWQPSLGGRNSSKNISNCFKCYKTKQNAIFPSKIRSSDIGLDLSVIDKSKEYGDVILYGTGLKIEPSHGYFFMVVPRSSISKTGYMLANSIGIIDPSYTGEIMIALRKVDKNAPDLPLPSKVAQLIVMPAIRTELIEVDELSITERGSGGFGSTDKYGDQTN